MGWIKKGRVCSLVIAGAWRPTAEAGAASNGALLGTLWTLDTGMDSVRRPGVGRVPRTCPPGYTTLENVLTVSII